MSARLFPLCVLLALVGCGDGSKAPSVAKGGPPAAKPELPPEPVKAAPEKGVSETPKIAAETPKAAKPEVSDQEETTEGGAVETAAADEEQPAAAKKAGSDKEEEEPPTEQQALRAAQKKAQKGDWKGAIGELEKALAADEENFNLLVNLTFLCQNAAQAGEGKIDYSMYEKSADYLKRALKIKPEFNKNPNFRQFAASVLYNAACAQAVEMKPEAALDTLKESFEYGYKDFSKLEDDHDMESVRALPEYPELLAKAREKAREQMREEVEKLIADTKPFPFDFELTDIDGKAIAKADFKGKVLIVDVWGTWCPPCRAEIPSFVTLHKKYQEAGLEIVGLNSERIKDEDEALTTVKEFHKENGMTYRCALAKRDTIEQIPEMEGYPTTLFFDRAGKVRVKIVGLHDLDTLEAIVQRLLEEKPEEAAGAR